MSRIATPCFLALILLIISRSRAIFKITRLDCTNLDKDFTTIEYCRLKAIRRNVAAISVKIQLHRIIRECQLHIEILRRYNDYKPFLFNNTFDGCKFMKNIKSAEKTFPIATLVFNIIRKSTNINHTCPYEGAILVDNFYPEHKDLPLPLPTGNYMFIANWFVENRIRTQFKAQISFVEAETFARRKRPKKGPFNRSSLMAFQ